MFRIRALLRVIRDNAFSIASVVCIGLAVLGVIATVIANNMSYITVVWFLLYLSMTFNWLRSSQLVRSLLNTTDESLDLIERQNQAITKMRITNEQVTRERDEYRAIIVRATDVDPLEEKRIH